MYAKAFLFALAAAMFSASRILQTKASGCIWYGILVNVCAAASLTGISTYCTFDDNSFAKVAAEASGPTSSETAADCDECGIGSDANGVARVDGALIVLRRLADPAHAAASTARLQNAFTDKPSSV